MAAEGGPAVDLRDDGTVRAALLHMLVDWHGTDLKDVYEPLTDQLGYLYSAWLLIIFIGIIYGLYTKWYRIRKEKPLPYKVIKPPANLVDTSTKRRVVAVVGATGFVGSNVVKQLIENGNYIVYMIGRRFTDDKINPKADAVFQVDMMNYEALLSAFSGVDTVIHAAAALPNVFISDDDIWRINVVGSENVLSAARKCGVKNFVFVTGLKAEGKIENKTARTFVNALTHVEELVTDSNGLGGVSTCALCFGHIYGLNEFHEKILKGELDRLPLSDVGVSCIPVSYVASAIIKAAEKLAVRDQLVAGTSITVAGQDCSFRDLFSVKEWGHKVNHMSFGVLRFMARFNVVVARVIGRAPFGVDLCPAVCSFFDFNELEEFDADIARNVLGLDPVPSIEDGVAELRREFEEKQKLKTN